VKKIFWPVTASLALALAVPAASSAAIVPVTSLSGAFAASNSSVASTNDGVQFGPYADGGVDSGSVIYNGANGMTLSQISSLAFTERHHSADDNAIATPYLRVFLNNNADDIIFDATQCATVKPLQDTVNHFDVIAGTVRFDDDPCVVLNQQTWAQVVAAHGSEVVSGIRVTTGFTSGLDLSAMLLDLTVNGDTFCFNCPPLPLIGPPGATGAAGPAGPAGAPLFVPAVTTGASNSVNCHGDALRTLHAPRVRGARFLSVRATLRGKRLTTSGRSIRVDLRKRSEGNYNVRLTSRYRKGGRTLTIRTQRNISVTCA
jgi:hypothetical protein